MDQRRGHEAECIEGMQWTVFHKMSVEIEKDIEMEMKEVRNKKPHLILFFTVSFG